MRSPTLSIDILIIKDGKILLGLLTEEWSINNMPTYGLPGREINFGESFGDAVERNIKEELDCKLLTHSIIAVNANYALGNHFVGIGTIATIEGEPKNMKPGDWQKWEWIDRKNLPDNLFPPAHNLLQSYLQDKITVSE
jgi:ADP-ribose pyrophosphatase YjhB (NUDIX family)